ncbi:hypothetical protein VNO80_18292 [Phaseolus coccineus]|uniref:Uncharacterized protein n=1 Tax=Phaseolus coccineus TaxID=3886 RepID=A0AAN9QYS8_PHACN
MLFFFFLFPWAFHFLFFAGFVSFSCLKFLPFRSKYLHRFLNIGKVDSPKAIELVAAEGKHSTVPKLFPFSARPTCLKSWNNHAAPFCFAVIWLYFAPLAL